MKSIQKDLKVFRNSSNSTIRGDKMKRNVVFVLREGLCQHQCTTNNMQAKIILSHTSQQRIYFIPIVFLICLPSTFSAPLHGTSKVLQALHGTTKVLQVLHDTTKVL